MRRFSAIASATFFHERLEFYLRDVCGYAYDVVKAVLGADAEDVVDAVQRAEAVRQVLHMSGIQVDWRGLQAHAEYTEAS